MDIEEIVAYENLYILHVRGLEEVCDNFIPLTSLPKYDNEQYSKILAENLACMQRLENHFSRLKSTFPSRTEEIEDMEMNTFVVLTPGGAEYLRRKSRLQRPWRLERPQRSPHSSAQQRTQQSPRPRRSPPLDITAIDASHLNPKDPYYWIEAYGSIGL